VSIKYVQACVCVLNCVNSRNFEDYNTFEDKQIVDMYIKR